MARGVRLDAQANMVNLFDKRYETSAWYPQPGREFMVSLRWQPD